MAQRLVRGLRALKPLFLRPSSKPINCILKNVNRNYASVSGEMRKSAFEGNILRLIRNDIQYELDYSSPPEPISEYNEFKVDERSGEQWIKLTRKFNEKEEIKVEVTMFDGSIPVKETAETPEHVKLHITMVVDIFKGEDNEALQFICSAWPDTIEISKVFTRKPNQTTYEPYMGPNFKELDDELQNCLYDFLEERGIDEDLAEFLHGYMKHKDKREHIRWMENLKSYVLEA